MKKSKIFVCVTALLCLAVMVMPCLASCEPKTPEPDYTPKPNPDGTSMTFRFKETTETISNPGVGYTTTDWYHTKLNGTLMHDKQGAIVLFFVHLGPYSAGSNGTTVDGEYVEGVDYDLDQTFFDALRATFENCRKNGSTIALRFRYDEIGKSNPEPKTFDMVLRHISQIKESGLLQDFSDILMFVESGFVGSWGEQHGGKYTSVEYKAQLLDAMLDCVPAPIPVTVRTPDTFAAWAGIERKDLATYTPEPGSEASRVGIYDDGYMGSDSDLGTYANRPVETAWIGRQTETSYFGGEFSGNFDFASKFDTYEPENALKEMYLTHLSYINGNIFPAYEDDEFDEDLEVAGFDNSAYYGQTVFKFIRDHIGYRIVLKQSEISTTVEQGGEFDLSFTVCNNGFANLLKKQKCQVILERDGQYVCTDVDVDPVEWRSGKTQKESLKLNVPAFLSAGKWNVYFKSSFGNVGMEQFSLRSLRFANDNVWNSSLGANLLGTIEVKSTENKDNLVQNAFFQSGAKQIETAQLLQYSTEVKVDGEFSFGNEWTADELVADNGQNKLYVSANEENLFLATDIAHNSEAPVFNVRITANDVTYWIYVQSNGAVYFNHEADTGHVGLELKYTDKAFEYKIPLYMLKLTDKVEIANISVFIQDSADEWKGTGSIQTDKPVTVEQQLTVYNAFEKLKVKENSKLTLDVLVKEEIASIVWLHNGEDCGNNSTTLTLADIEEDNVGLYSVVITTAHGTQRTVKIAEIELI